MQNYEEKNIRRRVYDALNVLMAINIIEKESDSVTFRGKGVPSGTDSVKLLQVCFYRFGVVAASHGSYSRPSRRRWKIGLPKSRRT